MVTRNLRSNANSNIAGGAPGPILRPNIPREGDPLPTPKGNVGEIPNSTQAQIQNQVPNFVLIPGSSVRNRLPPPPPPQLSVPADAVQQLVLLLNRHEAANQERSYRFTELEGQVAALKARNISDRASPEPNSPERRNAARRRHRSPPRRRHYHRSPPRRNDGGPSQTHIRAYLEEPEEEEDEPRIHSSWASSSPRRRSHSRENSPRGEEPRGWKT